MKRPRALVQASAMAATEDVLHTLVLCRAVYVGRITPRVKSRSAIELECRAVKFIRARAGDHTNLSAAASSQLGREVAGDDLYLRDRIRIRSQRSEVRSGSADECFFESRRTVVVSHDRSGAGVDAVSGSQ